MRVKNTVFQTVLEIITLMVLVAMVLTILIAWRELPEEVPVHYNFKGIADGWGSKNTLLVIPIIGVVMVVGIFILSRLPKLWNMAVTPGKNTKEQLYTSTKNMIACLNLEVSLVFFYLTYSMDQSTLSPYFLPVELVVILGTLGFFMYEQVMIGRSEKCIIIDSEVTRLKKTFPISKYWLIIPGVLAAVPYLFLSPDGGGNGLPFALILTAEVLSFAIAYACTLKMRSKFFSEDHRVNIYLNRTRIRELSKAWVFAACVAAIFGVILYSILYISGFTLSLTILILYLSHAIIICLAVQRANSNIRFAQNVLVKERNGR